MIGEEAMALFAGGFADDAELDHVPQCFRYGGGGEGELFGRGRDGDDGFALKVLVDVED